MAILSQQPGAGGGAGTGAGQAALRQASTVRPKQPNRQGLLGGALKQLGGAAPQGGQQGALGSALGGLSGAPRPGGGGLANQSGAIANVLKGFGSGVPNRRRRP